MTVSSARHLRRQEHAILAAGFVAWLALSLYVAWCCRYWINSDTIGTLDSARAL